MAMVRRTSTANSPDAARGEPKGLRRDGAQTTTTSTTALVKVRATYRIALRGVGLTFAEAIDLSVNSRWGFWAVTVRHYRVWDFACNSDRGCANVVAPRGRGRSFMDGPLAHVWLRGQSTKDSPLERVQTKNCTLQGRPKSCELDCLTRQAVLITLPV